MKAAEPGTAFRHPPISRILLVAKEQRARAAAATQRVLLQFDQMWMNPVERFATQFA
jgi:hypothetical protein